MNLPIAGDKCERCAGQHSVEGCPRPAELVGEGPTFVLYWPPNPDPESWINDVPNEGISYNYWKHGDEITLASMYADYHGYYLLDPNGIFALPDVETYGETDAVYAQAYAALEKLGLRPTLQGFCTVMESLGWKQVVYVETDDKYFKWKD